MEKKILLLLVVITFKSFAQDTITYKPTHSQIFSLSPISKKVDKVNGFVFGVGHYENKNIQKQTVNGLNVEASPLGIMAPILLMFSTDKRFNAQSILEDFEISLVKVNGINISTGGFTAEAEMNGLNISTLTQMTILNGMSISLFGIGAKKTNGITIAGFFNYNQKLNGVSIALLNESFDFNGLQMGLFNNCKNQMIGIQIGIVNISNRTKGLQIGLLNINKKRAFPFINF